MLCNICNHIYTGYSCKHCSSYKWEHCGDLSCDWCDWCLNISFVSHEKSKYWHDELNNNLTPINVQKTTHKKCWFKCAQCNHSFDMRICHVTNGVWCPYCGNQKLCNNNCEICYNKSFQSVFKSSYWNEKKNNGVLPRQIFKCTGKKYWFTCDVCCHDFELRLDHVRKNVWCPYCNISKLCDDNDCKRCYEKSFQSHEKCKYWISSLNEKNPRCVSKTSKDKYWFLCDVCNHQFQISIVSIVNRFHWCSYCAKQKLCGIKECLFCYKNSFASNSKSKIWHLEKNLPITPLNVFNTSLKKYWFKCETCTNNFYTSISSVSKGTKCNICFHKTEKQLFKWLVENYENVEYQKTFEWCKTDKNTYYKYDFYLPNEKVIIELDGIQHFQQVYNWQAPEIIECTDKIKMEKAIKNGIRIIRIFQEDVYNDKDDWQKKLNNAITKSENYLTTIQTTRTVVSKKYEEYNSLFNKSVTPT